MSGVIVGMSGGVDSAVAAYLLKAAGHEVKGVTLRHFVTEDGQESRCCEISDAEAVCDRLEIPYYVIDCFPEFAAHVTEPFVRDYLSGLTPNPCVACNRHVKWSGLFKAAERFGASYVATGHYARIVKTSAGRYTVQKALHENKDQAYMLYRLTQEQLMRTIMPLGALSKEEVRTIAQKAGIPVADKPDSQEICFVPDGDYADYVAAHASEVTGPGSFVDEDGRVLGIHKGIIHYTVGQRRGLNLPLGYPAYVKEIRPETGEVVIAPEEHLYSREILCRSVNFMSIEGLAPGEELHCQVKIRYHHPGAPATLTPAETGADGDVSIRVLFDEPVRAAAPGQSAVFYDADGCVIGGGIIAKEQPGRVA